MRNLTLAAVSLLLLVGFSACGGASPNLEPVASPESGAVIGSIKVPGGINNVSLLELGKVYAGPFAPPPRGHVYTNGMFVFENLKPGTYFIDAFLSGRNRYSLVTARNTAEAEKWVKKYGFEVKPGAIHYYGSLEVTSETGPGFFTAGKFALRRTGRPSEKEILQELMQFTAGSGWEKKFQQRLRRLK